MKIIGLTGSIGTGKSTVSKIFADLGAYIIDADRIARDVVEPGTEAWSEIIDSFSTDILNPDKTINRDKLGYLVFSDIKARERLNSITHPKIKKKILQFINESEKKGIKVVIIEAALLVEKGGLINLIDKLIIVDAQPETQIKRIMKRDNIKIKDAISRIESQMPLSEKIKHADYVIDNNGDLQSTMLQVEKLWDEIN